MAPPPAGYAYPIYAPHAHSRSHSRSRSADKGKDPRLARLEEDETRRRILDEERRKEDERRAEKKRAVEAYKAEERERELREEEAAAEALRKFEREREELEELERETVAKFKAKEEAKRKKNEEEEKAAYERYRAREAEKKVREKEKAEREDEEYKKRFREHLAKAGYAPNQIDAVIAMEKLKIDENATPGTMVHRPGNTLARTKSANSASYGQIIPGVRQQVFPKIRRKDIAVETLKHYKLEWEYCKEDSNYIVILEELSEEDTDVLFYHTQKLRAKEKKKEEKSVLQIEERGDKRNPRLLLVRRKSSAGKAGRSKSRTRERSGSHAGRIAGAVLGVK